MLVSHWECNLTFTRSRGGLFNTSVLTGIFELCSIVSTRFWEYSDNIRACSIFWYSSILTLGRLLPGTDLFDDIVSGICQVSDSCIGIISFPTLTYPLFYPVFAFRYVLAISIAGTAAREMSYICRYPFSDRIRCNSWTSRFRYCEPVRTSYDDNFIQIILSWTKSIR